MQVISTATVLSIKDLPNEVKEYTLKLERNRYFEPGSLVQLTLEKVDASSRWPESRTFSMASSYNKQKVIKLLVKKEGVFTNRIFNELKIGSECTIKYGFGEMLLPDHDDTNPIVCLAGGTGIAPFFSFIEAIIQEKRSNDLYLFYSVKKEEYLINLDYLNENIEKERLSLFFTREKSNTALNRRIEVNDIISKVKSSPKEAHYYLSGGKDFVTSIKKSLMQIGVEKIYFDEW